MLQIRDIRKKYVTGDLTQTALDGVSLTLRDNEFVAILGPSGSGKTTLLNVIGGLDRYDSGDLIINGISTRKYTDRDWDSYRNHTIGFVFQSYNLIPHQTVLANVELALTISGISRSERRARAKKALEDVGLGNQLHKRPNQMSGGQMQRVAIARALVNNPDILLADEPTGALDSDTSVQIMDLLQEVAKDRLVVMVTHNPELAEAYANRIVRVRDGRIVDDTNPFDPDASPEDAKHKNMGKSSMSFLTALSLSFNNLKTKLARTLLTSFAGSIGIIGIALIMSLSTGFQLYVDQIQEDTLSNYPLSIQSETADMTAAMSAFGASMNQAAQAEEGTVVEQQMISQMFAQIGSNDLGAFKAYLEENYAQVAHAVNDIQYSYGVKPMIFSADTSERVLQVNPGVLFGQMTGSSLMSSYMDSDAFYEMVGNTQMLDSQYEILQGRWPEAYNELVFVLQDAHILSDYLAYTVGLKDPDILSGMIQQVMRGEEPQVDLETGEWTYDDLMALEFRLVDASSLYAYNADYDVWENMSGDEAYLRRVVEEGDPLRVVGVVCPREGVSTMTLTPGIAYRSELTEYVISRAKDSEIVANQLANPQVDVFTGQEFGDDEEKESLSFEDMISIDGNKISNAFGMNISTDAVMKLVQDYLSDLPDSIVADTAAAQADFTDAFSRLATDMLESYLAANPAPAGGAELALEDVSGIVDSYLASESASAIVQPMAGKYQLSTETFTDVYRPLLNGMLTSYVAEKLAGDIAGDIVDGLLPTLPDAAPAEETQPETSPTETPTVPEEDPTTATEDPSLPTEAPDPTQPEEPDAPAYRVTITQEEIPGIVSSYQENSLFTGTSAVMAGRMTESSARQSVLDKLDGMDELLMSYIGGSFYVDQDMLASAFQFDLNEEELRRLMEAMSSTQQDASAQSNLRSLGYAELTDPTMISVYLIDFAGKEDFLSFLDDYNEAMEASNQEDLVIRYTDLTGIMMSSVRTIIDSVSYVLIAFVAVSLVVSSIMIGIITYISVMERTREIGVLRAIGASRRNISQVFNAETFIIGLCSGLIGVGCTLLLNIPINYIIHSLTDSQDINAQLPIQSAVILVVLSMVLTLIGGFIPAKKAAKKDPVIALRSE